MNRFLTVFCVLVLTAAFSCGGGEDSQPADDAAADPSSEEVANDTVDKEAGTAVEETVAEPDTVEEAVESPEAYLEMCYATSINMPESAFGPENVFDGDTATYWATMPGAGPDEGLYFTFAEPQDIQTITVHTVPGSSEYEGVETIQLYVNGLEGGVRSPGTTLYAYGRTRSVFVKIVNTESTYRDEQGIRYQRDVPVAVSEIEVIVQDDSGNEVPLRMIPIAEMEGSVSASSSLDPVEAYSPDFLFDSRIAFGWADGNPEETGEGEGLTFSFQDPVNIQQLKIWNGYHRSREHFDQNERAASISFGTAGEDSSVYRLDDTMSPQVVYLNEPLSGSDFKLDVLEIYSGETYRDLVISELHFFDGEKWFVMDTGGSEERKTDVLEWAEGCAARYFIDKQLYSDESQDWYYIRQSMIIRSNGSFVIWTQDERDDSEERMYADGNWQIIDDNTIRIFGRLHRLASYDQDRYDPYAGTWSDQDERLDRMTIFSDTIQFGEGWISSERGLFEDFQFSTE